MLVDRYPAYVQLKRSSLGSSPRLYQGAKAMTSMKAERATRVPMSTES